MPAAVERGKRRIDGAPAAGADLALDQNATLGQYEIRTTGAIFVALRVVQPANEITYWPGAYPGPPGFEWSSNRCKIGMELSNVGDAITSSARRSAVCLAAR